MLLEKEIFVPHLKKSRQILRPLEPSHIHHNRVNGFESPMEMCQSDQDRFSFHGPLFWILLVTEYLNFPLKIHKEFKRFNF